jgi:hypothetical protein
MMQMQCVLYPYLKLRAIALPERLLLTRDFNLPLL